MFRTYVLSTYVLSTYVSVVSYDGTCPRTNWYQLLIFRTYQQSSYVSVEDNFCRNQSNIRYFCRNQSNIWYVPKDYGEWQKHESGFRRLSSSFRRYNKVFVVVSYDGTCPRTNWSRIKVALPRWNRSERWNGRTVRNGGTVRSKYVLRFWSHFNVSYICTKYVCTKVLIAF